MSVQPLISAEVERYVTELSWSVIPLQPNSKRPTSSWQELITRTATMDEVFTWYEENENANVGVPTGRVSRVVVIDVDGPIGDAIVSALGGLPKSPTVRTGRGSHHYFRYSGSESGKYVKEKVDGTTKTLLEIKATGQYVVAPPSVHPNGSQYTWEVPPWDFEELPEPPGWVVETLKGDKNQPLKWLRKAIAELLATGEGGRNDALNKEGYKLARRIKIGWYDEDGLRQCLTTLGHLMGLDAAEVEATVNSCISGGKNDSTSADDQTDTEAYRQAFDDLGYYFARNLITDGVEVNDKPIDDYVMSKMSCEMYDLGHKNSRLLEDTHKMIADENAYHPLRNYLHSLEWDGQDHIRELSKHFQVLHPTPDVDGEWVNLFHLWFYRWILGAVERTFNGRQNVMLVLDGRQGAGKSYFVKWLGTVMGREYFNQSSVKPSSNDDLIQLIEKWVWEVGELGATMRQADREALKAFISREYVTVRRPYRRTPSNQPALASFVGTINNEAGFLNDPTGNRRFLVVTIGKVNWSYSDEIDPNQVWAQAMALYTQGERGQLTEQEKQLSTKLNEEYEAPNPLLDELQEYFVLEPDNRNFATHTRTILDYLDRHGYKNAKSRSTSMAVASVLKQQGFDKAENITIGDTRTKGYYGIRPKAVSSGVSMKGVLWLEKE